MYYTGNGVERDVKMAVVWFQKAANQGNAMAQYQLGVCLENGIGVVKDEREAIEWYKKAAELGHEEARERMKSLDVR